MANFRERLQEWLDYMGIKHQARLAEILTYDDGKPASRQTLSGWLNPKTEHTPSYGELLRVVDRLGTSLDWQTGRADGPMWSPEIQNATVWLRGELHRVAGHGDIMHPMHARMLSLMKVMSERVPLLRERWFAAGILGLSPEKFEEFEAGMLTVSKPIIGRLSVFTGVPEKWIQSGDGASMKPLENLGEYTPLVAHWASKGITATELQEVVDLVAETALARKA